MNSKLSKSEKTKQHILETALKLFSKNGFDNTTMREIATHAGLSLGASYYYYKSKEELVLAYYEQTAKEDEVFIKEHIPNTKDYRKILTALLEFKFAQLNKQKELLSILSRHGADPTHPLSPFSTESTQIRNSSIKLIQTVLLDSNLKAHKQFEPYLPKLFWLFELSIISFWIRDKSKGSKNTKELLNLSLGIIEKLLTLSRLPGFSIINKKALQIFKLTGFDSA